MPMVDSAALPSGTSRFGALRHRKDGSQTTHNGVDLYADRGDPVKSPGAGTVMHANNNWVKGFGDYGRVVVVALDSGGEVLAGHLDYVAVSPGQRVERGEKIGTVGDTRFSDDNPTGTFQRSKPHTHVEFLKGHSYPVRRDVPREDPTQLAFYDVSIPERAPQPSPKAKPVPPEAFATMADAQQRARALLNRWNALSSQASGPSAAGRADIPRNLQNAIIDDRARFREFMHGPAFGLGTTHLGQFAGSDYNTLKRWYAKYETRARQVANALPAGEHLAANATPLALPRQLSMVEIIDVTAKTAQGVLYAAGFATLLGVAIAIAVRSSR